MPIIILTSALTAIRTRLSSDRPITPLNKSSTPPARRSPLRADLLDAGLDAAPRLSNEKRGGFFATTPSACLHPLGESPPPTIIYRPYVRTVSIQPYPVSSSCQYRPNFAAKGIVWPYDPISSPGRDASTAVSSRALRLQPPLVTRNQLADINVFTTVPGLLSEISDFRQHFGPSHTQRDKTMLRLLPVLLAIVVMSACVPIPQERPPTPAIETVLETVIDLRSLSSAIAKIHSVKNSDELYYRLAELENCLYQPPIAFKQTFTRQRDRKDTHIHDRLRPRICAC